MTNKCLVFVTIVAIIVIIAIIVFACRCRKTSASKSFTPTMGGIKVSPKMTPQDIVDWKTAQKKMTNILKVFVGICTKHNIKNWWVVAGTLIGTVRHAGWIPWDGDVDLAMMEEDYNKFKKVVQKELPKGMWYQSPATDSLYTVKGMHKLRDLNSCYLHKNRTWKWQSGLQIDIFIYKEIKRHGRNYIKPDHLMHDIKTYASDLVLPPRQMKFEGIDVNVPNKVQKYCKKNFGSYPPGLPKLSDRAPHEGSGKVDPNNACPQDKENYSQLYKAI